MHLPPHVSYEACLRREAVFFARGAEGSYLHNETSHMGISRLGSEPADGAVSRTVGSEIGEGEAAFCSAPSSLKVTGVRTRLATR